MKRGTSIDKPLTENETRNKYLNYARNLGCYQELLQVFDRYDKLLKKCTNVVERQQIAIMANVEVHKLFNFRNPLIVGGKEILPGDPDWKEEVL